MNLISNRGQGIWMKLTITLYVENEIYFRIATCRVLFLILKEYLEVSK